MRLCHAAARRMRWRQPACSGPVAVCVSAAGRWVCLCGAAPARHMCAGVTPAHRCGLCAQARPARRGSWRRVEGAPHGAGCAPPAAGSAPRRWRTRRTVSIGTAQPHRGAAPHTTSRGHEPVPRTVDGGATTTHRPVARAAGRASWRAACRRGHIAPQSACAAARMHHAEPALPAHRTTPHARAGRWLRGVPPHARGMPCGVRVVRLHPHVSTAARMPDRLVRGCTRGRRWRLRTPPASDSEGIRTPAGRAQWISSPSP